MKRHLFHANAELHFSLSMLVVRQSDNLTHTKLPYLAKGQQVFHSVLHHITQMFIKVCILPRYGSGVFSLSCLKLCYKARRRGRGYVQCSNGTSARVQAPLIDAQYALRVSNEKKLLWMGPLSTTGENILSASLGSVGCAVRRNYDRYMGTI